ncbi:MAG: alanine racemase, partial [Arachnia propionica]
MSLTLTIDSAAWRNHLDEFSAEVPGLVPVAKGNGYGFGLGRLAGESARLPADALAVGTAHEVPMVRSAGWEGDIVVLNPVRP